MEKELRIYQTRYGKEPWKDWIVSLKDRIGRAQINARLVRIAVGHYGDCKALGDGLFELRIHYGPGYRVYFAEEGNSIVLLLMGGSKAGQKRDIEKAKSYWVDFQERCHEQTSSETVYWEL